MKLHHENRRKKQTWQRLSFPCSASVCIIYIIISSNSWWYVREEADGVEFGGLNVTNRGSMCRYGFFKSVHGPRFVSFNNRK